jgi:hypothetical protein
MAAYATIDESAFPIVTIRFTGQGADDQNFQEYLDNVRALYDREERLALIFDARQASLPGLKYQKMQAQWLKEYESLMQAYCAGTAYIIKNPLIRSVLKAIFSFQKQPVPYSVLASQEEAEAWAQQHLQ